ncbi:MAG TPA: porin [Allosphingosinicella sp.]|nr:porin [Allosphingosinicella sp.]
MAKSAFLAALLATASATPALAAADPVPTDFAADVAAMRAEIAALRAEVAELKAGRDSAPGAPSPAAPTSAGTPTVAAAATPAGEKTGGSLTFKPFGRLQYDFGFVESPPGVTDRGLGFGSEVRRARLGAEGAIPGGFGYKIEVDFANSEVEIADAFLSYKASKALGLTLGQHNNFQSIEELTSSRYLSFLERAAFTDAFNFERRIGLSATWSFGSLIAQGGIFTDNIEDLADAQDAVGLGDENDAFSLDGRIVYAPKAGKAQLHFGASAHWRNNGDTAAAGPATRYRQRPFVHTSNSRFLATPGLRVGTETDYGFEAALVRGPLHAAAEAHWLNADTLIPGLSPTFFGGYAEIGWFLTGESRGYKGGRWDRTKVRRPVGGGGAGALQINLRYDHLDLTDGGIVGGRQRGYEASLVWIAQDHVRFLLNYGHLRFDDSAIAASGGDRDYGIDVFGARAQVDF